MQKHLIDQVADDLRLDYIQTFIFWIITREGSCLLSWKIPEIILRENG